MQCYNVKLSLANKTRYSVCKHSFLDWPKAQPHNHVAIYNWLKHLQECLTLIFFVARSRLIVYRQLWPKLGLRRKLKLRWMVTHLVKSLSGTSNKRCFVSYITWCLILMWNIIHMFYIYHPCEMLIKFYSKLQSICNFWLINFYSQSPSICNSFPCDDSLFEMLVMACLCDERCQKQS